ncbi:IniB N-terminal domain-containing protein [Microbacterium sp. Marseille-Q6965]|uniref:IniB N-terminal domain-containing protein n=1 Tax=Microbacterium sp. Marseille-Q6965 TaxID=2965072 RepID=UPI0021B72BED|nr:IniB N-terminal domain-containing protein [Microbacterium sp. Marseille-Q6965]
MSVTLATMADALIEFILSLLRDPTAAAEFEEDPQGTLAARGLNNASPADVCAVAPVIAERPAVVAVHHDHDHGVAPKPAPKPAPEPDPDPVVREVKNIMQNFSWVDDRDTVVDQSVNQNIWADGDVTQVFDQEAVVASGDESMAAGDDATVDNTVDQSTNIDAGGDVNVGNDTEVVAVDDSYNEDTDTSTETDNSTDVVVDDSANDSSTTETAEDSYNDSTVEYTETDVDSSATFETTEEPLADATAADDDI